MIEHYHNKARYPEPPSRPTAWSGWRRKHGSGDAWRHVDGTDKSTKGECYQALMDLSELVGGEPVVWDYVILAKDERPPIS